MLTKKEPTHFKFLTSKFINYENKAMVTFAAVIILGILVFIAVFRWIFLKKEKFGLGGQEQSYRIFGRKKLSLLLRPQKSCVIQIRFLPAALYLQLCSKMELLLRMTEQAQHFNHQVGVTSDYVYHQASSSKDRSNRYG